MYKFMLSFARADHGTTAIEYALITGLIFLAIVTSVHLLGSKMDAMYLTIGAAM